MGRKKAVNQNRLTAGGRVGDRALLFGKRPGVASLPGDQLIIDATKARSSASSLLVAAILDFANSSMA